MEWNQLPRANYLYVQTCLANKDDSNSCSFKHLIILSLKKSSKQEPCSILTVSKGFETKEGKKSEYEIIESSITDMPYTEWKANKPNSYSKHASHPLTITFEWCLSPVSISDFDMVIPTQVTPVQIHGGEVKNDLQKKKKKRVKFKIDLAKSSYTEISMMSTWHPHETSHSSCMFLPFHLVWQIFSRYSACKRNTHLGNQERKSCHCCPVDCHHILFAKTHTQTCM